MYGKKTTGTSARPSSSTPRAPSPVRGTTCAPTATRQRSRGTGRARGLTRRSGATGWRGREPPAAPPPGARPRRPRPPRAGRAPRASGTGIGVGADGCVGCHAVVAYSTMCSWRRRASVRCRRRASRCARRRDVVPSGSRARARRSPPSVGGEGGLDRPGGKREGRLASTGGWRSRGPFSCARTDGLLAR